MEFTSWLEPAVITNLTTWLTAIVDDAGVYAKPVVVTVAVGVALAHGTSVAMPPALSTSLAASGVAVESLPQPTRAVAVMLVKTTATKILECFIYVILTTPPRACVMLLVTEIFGDGYLLGWPNGEVIG